MLLMLALCACGSWDWAVLSFRTSSSTTVQQQARWLAVRARCGRLCCKLVSLSRQRSMCMTRPMCGFLCRMQVLAATFLWTSLHMHCRPTSR